MSEYRVMITGNRPHKLAGAPMDEIKARMERHILNLKNTHGNDLVILTGMAQGPDQWAVIICTKHGIKFDAYLPFMGQECRWSIIEQGNYRNLLTHAHQIFIASSCPSKMAFLRRNDDMVADCMEAIAVFNGDYASGTGYTVRRIKAADKPYTNVYGI